VAQVFREFGHVPVDRGDPLAAASTIDTDVAMLAAGKAVGIYPEGTRSPNGRPYRFRTGLARLALRSGEPVIPVGLVGTGQALIPVSAAGTAAPSRCTSVRPWTSPDGQPTNDHRRSSARSPKPCARQSSDYPASRSVEPHVWTT
jgi:1-acyl-sn-glycerol-3-phosphate acyltransferase